jgi:WD40 repeat protein
MHRKRSAALLNAWLVALALPALSATLEFSRNIGLDWPSSTSFWMNYVALSADGKTVASNGRGRGLWNYADGKFIRTVPEGLLSPDFKLIATDDALIETESGKRRASLPKGHRAETFSADGMIVAYVSGGGRIHVVSTAAGSVMRAFNTRYTSALAIQDNQTLASGHWDNVTLWNLRTGERVALLAGFEHYISGISFSKDGRYLAAGTDTGYLQIWDVASRKHLSTVKLGTSYVSNPAFSPDGKWIAAGTYNDGMLSLIDVAAGKLLQQIQVSMFGCGSVAFTPDGRFVLTPSNSGQLNSGRFQTGGSVRVFQLLP